mmetsp:Transcript_980/g.2708  ORF Transcript_980/g.2708 Transcript_980/m.2708 type:complete len:263 (+) Transcript_980:830-1618(+)
MVIMFITFESLYALAPKKLPPSAISTPFLPSAAALRPLRSPRSARGYTRPPPMVFVLPVIEPTMTQRGSLAALRSSMRRRARRKCPTWLMPIDCSRPSSVNRGSGSAGRYTAALQMSASRGRLSLKARRLVTKSRTERRLPSSSLKMAMAFMSRPSFLATAFIFSGSRTAHTTKWLPPLTSAFSVERPRPEEVPVMTTSLRKPIRRPPSSLGTSGDVYRRSDDWLRTGGVATMIGDVTRDATLATGWCAKREAVDGRTSVNA